MNQPYFSIIIPTYNRAEFIEKTVKSVLNQTYTNFELIVVDDGSTDNTKEIVASINDKRIRYYWKENAERGAARNFGIKKAKGEYITFLDSDDLLYPNHFAEANQLIILSSPSIFCQNYDIKNSNGKLIQKGKNFNSFINDDLIKGNHISINSIFILSGILNDNNFSEDRNFIGGEDWLLWLKLSARFKIIFINKITSTIVLHSERSVLNFNESSFKFRTNKLIEELIKDNIFMSVYGKYISSIHAHMLSYTALHAAIAKNNLLALKYLWFATIKNSKELFKRRTLAIFKLILRNIILK